MNPLAALDHRPWPLPQGPWLMVQVWRDLLFAHWPVPFENVRRLVPQLLQLDQFDGQCWLSITSFRLSIRARGLPPLPFAGRFPELNCRTYVNLGGKPGVFFFSLDAGSRMAVWAARRFYRLPYYYARMGMAKRGPTVFYSSHRRGADFNASYRTIGPVSRAKPGTLEHWLTERYCLYTVYKDRPFRAEIHHEPWPLQNAFAEIAENTIAKSAGVSLPQDSPLLAFARELKVLIWPLRRAD